MRKSILAVTVAVFLLLPQVVYGYQSAPQTSAESAVVYHADSGRVLWEKNAHSRHLIASTTKIMTALVALEQCRLEETVTVTKQMADVEGSSMYLQVGEDYTIRELLYGLMLASGNDAATAIALYIASDEAAFAELMNEKAAALGLGDTNFENPHGLDGENHYSTAYDMARLAAYAMENPVFAEIVGTRHITIKGIPYVNHNKLLWQCEGVDGLKTGYTMAAGRTLVSSCQRQGQRLICVTLSAPDDWNDHKQLYDWAYGQFETHVLTEKETPFWVPVLNGRGTKVRVEPREDVTVYLDDPSLAVCRVELPRFVFGPVFSGESAGRIVVTIGNKAVKEVPLVYMETIK